MASDPAAVQGSQSGTGRAANRTFVVLSTTDYDAPQFGSRQQIARRLAARGHRVLFVEVPRAVHSFWTAPDAARSAIRRAGRLREIAPRLLAWTPPFVLPLYYNRVTNALNQRWLARGIRRALATLSWQPDIVWTYWPNSAYLVRALGARISVYHCIDDFVAALGAGRHPFQRPAVLEELERELMAQVDAVAVRSAPLAERAASHAKQIWKLPGGVDTKVFDPSFRFAPPEAIARLPRPRIGWVGTLDDRVDTELLARCAEALPNASFIMVGPVKSHRTRIDGLQARPNVHLLSACKPDEVPAHLAALDVGILPYASGAYPRALSTVKLHEMLAMGLAIVSTALPYVESEAARFGDRSTAPDVCRPSDSIRGPAIACDAASFVSAIESWRLRPPTAAERSRWRARAAECSWGAQVTEIERLIELLIEGAGSPEGSTGEPPPAEPEPAFVR